MESVEKKAGGYGLFFVMPSSCSNAHKSARRLMRVKQIREVLITEGDCGFVVKAADADGIEHVSRKISAVVGGNSKIALCHFQYKK
ncbi:MAG: hypothetical protein M1569_01730 [Candidatus Marsarchaeota archaeon]|nr:hypothetical protein [Candidatus Marsarchaeota archaeon]MCL5413101.1 hypothetical protein [Candidatus Marsarchaeota archaeon]